jgi:hypothetical protein
MASKPRPRVEIEYCTQCREARDAGTEPDGNPSSVGSSNIRFRIVRDLKDRGPLGRMVAGRITALEVTWSDKRRGHGAPRAG